MASSIPLTNILDPSAAADQIQLDRRMRMAEILRQQALQPEQQQTAGGYVIPYSPFQGVSKLANAWLANRMDEQTDKQRTDMAQRQAQMLLNALRGPQSPQDTRFQGVTGIGFDAQGNAVQSPDVFKQQMQEGMQQPAPQSQQQGGGQFDIANLIRGNAIAQLGGDQAAGAYWKQYEPTDATKMAIAAGIDPRLANTAALQKASMYQMQPGAMTQNLLTGQNTFAPKVGEGIGLTPQGQAYAVPGYAQANANIQGSQAGAVEAAKAGWTPQTYQLPQGPTVLTQAQAARMAQGKGGQAGIPLQTSTQAAQEKAAAQASVDLPKTIDTANQLVDNINSLINHPGLKNAVGHVYSGLARQVPGSEAADFAAREAQIGGQTFLNAYQNLRGGGQITEVEGAKAQAALNRANRAQSQDDYIKAMTDYRDVIQKGVERARQAAGGNFNPSLPSFQQSPSGAKFIGFE